MGRWRATISSVLGFPQVDLVACRFRDACLAYPIFVSKVLTESPAQTEKEKEQGSHLNHTSASIITEFIKPGVPLAVGTFETSRLKAFFEFSLLAAFHQDE